MKKKHKSIFRELLVSYVVFALIAIIGIVVFLVIAIIQTAEQKGYDEDYPYIRFDEDGHIPDTEGIESIGGWVERIDDDYKVIEVSGKKQTKTDHYSSDEILEMTSPRTINDKREYYVFYHKKDDFTYLIFYPNDKFEIIYQIYSGEMVYTSFNKNILWGVLLFLVIEMLTVSMFISNKITKPMAALSKGMERVAAGEENVDIPTYKEKEFVGVQDAFAEMTLQLHQQKKEKEEIIQRRQQMLLELSHDIKTPVATIKSYAYALSEQMVPEEELNKYYGTIASKADRVNQLTMDLFTLLKMESEEYQVERQRLNITEMVRTILANSYEEVTDAGFDLDIEIPDEDIFMEGDSNYLTRAVENLLFNAKKYNKTGHYIQVKVEPATGDSTIVIQVRDDGEQIEKEIRETMFLAFVRGEKSRKSDGGTGLGLAITKQIIEKHGGTLTYTYEENHNCFTIQI